MNYQHWYGTDDPRYGYGRQLKGFVDNIPAGVKLDERASVFVYMGQPQFNKGWFDGQYKVCFTMYETDKIPETMAMYLGLYDKIIVPCDHNVELFSKYHKNVAKVQEGVDFNLFKPTKVPRSDRFQFRCGGSLWLRKGIDIVIEAFKKLNLPDADLRIKVTPKAGGVPDHVHGDNIYVDREWMTDEEQVRWFAEADCFVAPARGEGWGLIPMQTIAMGIPTIMSLTSGHLEFCDLATGTVPCGRSQSHLGGWWDEPDLDALVDQMREHYENHSQKKKQAAKNAVAIKRFTWDAAVAQLLEAVPEGTLLKNPTWHPSNVGIRVQALRTIRADIGRHSYRHNKGDIFEVTDGAYEVLYSNGAVVLAP